MNLRTKHGRLIMDIIVSILTGIPFSLVVIILFWNTDIFKTNEILERINCIPLISLLCSFNFFLILWACEKDQD